MHKLHTFHRCTWHGPARLPLGLGRRPETTVDGMFQLSISLVSNYQHVTSRCGSYSIWEGEVDQGSAATSVGSGPGA